MDTYVTHPHADSDGIVRDGNLRRTFFRMKVEGASDSEILHSFYILYNDRFFRSQLPRIPLEVVEGETDFHGRFHWETENGALTELKLLLRWDQFMGYEWFRESLLHEMCHVWVRCIEGDVSIEQDPHGEAWSRKASEMGLRLIGNTPR